MEGADGHKHDRVGEGAEDMAPDDRQQIPCRDPLRREQHHHPLRDDGRDEAADKGPAPDVHRRIDGRPAAGVVAQADLKGEIDQDGQGEVFLTEALIQKLEVRDAVVCLEADLGDQMDDDDALNILQFQDPDHAAVDLHDTVFFLGFVLALEHR